MPTHRLRTLLKATSKGGVQFWKTWVTEEGGAGVIHTEYGLVDGRAQTISEVIKAGKNAGKKNATTPYAQACAEAESRWEIKQSRKGYGITAEQSAAVRWAGPMLAHTYEKHRKKVDWSSGFAQPKLDGFRLLVRRDKDGTVRLTSRENQPLEALAHIKELFEAVPVPLVGKAKEAADYIVFDGEAYCHGMSLNEISSACKKKSEKSKKIQFHIYDCLLGTVDFETRSEIAKQFVIDASDDRLATVETVKVRSESDLMQCQKAFLEQGYEGAMLRHGNVGYQAGKRSAHLLKVKTWVDAEFEVVDYKLGRGKYEGVPVFMCVTEAGHTFDVTAPGTMGEKKALGEIAASCVGKRLTVRYIYMTKTEEPVPFLPVASAFRE